METWEDRHFFPLTSLQIGDLQSYLSRLTLFLATSSKKLYILVDNRPWSIGQDSRAAQLWQLMVTKSRLSPFANTRASKVRRQGFGKISKFSNSFRSPSINRNTQRNWFSLIDSALSHKKKLLRVKKLKDSFLLNKELHCPFYGFIVFEVEWTYVRGINYINELQTDTSIALEVKLMKRWEFDGIEQASSYISSWYTGNCNECYILHDYLESISTKGDAFYDAREHIWAASEGSKNLSTAADFHEEKHLCKFYHSFHYPEGMGDSETPFTPPANGPYKRRKITRSRKDSEINEVYEEAFSEADGSPISSVSSATSSSSESDHGSSAPEATSYKDVLILFRFDDHDLPFKLKDIITSDLRLLRLLECGLPSWVLFLQSYPIFCKIYRPWMCPLARVLYVLISVTTVLIGFYDLYKNVPLLKATASSLFGPLFDWIESWEMISRVKYLGTMLFLHNLEKAFKWFLIVARATRSLFSVLAKPIMGPIIELSEYVLPIWNAFFFTVESLSSIVWNLLSSSWGMITSILEIVVWPFWFVFSIFWRIGTYVLYPLFWLLWEIVRAPIRLILAIASLVGGVLFSNIYYLIQEAWLSVGVVFQLAFASKSTVASTVTASELQIWRSLWNDLFSKVFQAIRSIFNGFAAFFTACNRHRLSIYNHTLGFLHRFSHPTHRQRSSKSEQGRKKERYNSTFQASETVTCRSTIRQQDWLHRRRARRLPSET